MEKFSELGNVQLGKDSVLFSINPKIHKLGDIKEALKKMLASSCVILDGDPEREILVELRPKKRGRAELENISNKFLEELIKCS